MQGDSGWFRASIALCVGCFGISVHAMDIRNAGFEELVLNDDSSFNHAIPQWTHPNDGRSGTINPGSSQFPNSLVPEGTNAAFIATGSLYQELEATVQPNTTYRLSVQVGRGLEAANEFRGYVVRLMAGGQILAADNNGVSITPGTFAQVQISYESDAAGGAIGQPLGIHLGSADLPTFYWINTYFDSVSLSAQPVPEPSAGLLMGMGLMATLGASARRRRLLRMSST